MKSSAAISAHDISHDGAASKRVTTCSSTAKRTLINTLFFIRNTTPYISENRVFWLKYGFLTKIHGNIIFLKFNFL